MWAQDGHLRAILPSFRLEGKHVVSPPRACRPPSESRPNVPILFHEIEHVLGGSRRQLVVGRAKFSQKGALMMSPTPGGELLESFAANGGADHLRFCS